MPSLPAIIKLITSLAAVAQPQISKIIDNKKELAELKSENEKLKKENDYLKKQRIFLIVFIGVACVFYIFALIILFSKVNL